MFCAFLVQIASRFSPVGRAHKRVGRGDDGSRAEVPQLDLTRLGQQDITCLNIPEREEESMGWLKTETAKKSEEDRTLHDINLALKEKRRLVYL